MTHHDDQPAHQQAHPGTDDDLDPPADHGEESYVGSGRLEGKVAIITGGDSGIGRAVAIAYAREGADVVLAHLDEETEDAEITAGWVRKAGREVERMPGDLTDSAYCDALIARTVERFGRLDVLVSNAAYQMSRSSLDEISDDEFRHTLDVNLGAYFRLVRAAAPHLKGKGSVIVTSSIQSDDPSPHLLPYAATKAGIDSMTSSFAQLLGPDGIRVNSVAPGPIWTPLIPATMPPEAVESFGQDVPLGRPGQPAELAPAYVLLASDEGSYMSGSVVAVTGGRAIL